MSIVYICNRTYIIQSNWTTKQPTTEKTVCYRYRQQMRQHIKTNSNSKLTLSCVCCVYGCTALHIHRIRIQFIPLKWRKNCEHTITTHIYLILSAHRHTAKTKTKNIRERERVWAKREPRKFSMMVRVLCVFGIRIWKANRHTSCRWKIEKPTTDEHWASTTTNCSQMLQ